MKPLMCTPAAFQRMRVQWAHTSRTIQAWVLEGVKQSRSISSIGATSDLEYVDVLQPFLPLGVSVVLGRVC